MVFVDLVKWTARNKLDRGQLVIAVVTLMVSLMTSRFSAAMVNWSLRWSL